MTAMTADLYEDAPTLANRQVLLHALQLPAGNALIGGLFKLKHHGIPVFDLLWRGVVIGIGATILMDIWAVVLWKIFGEPRPNWGPVGRWFWHLRRGKVFHDAIAQSEPYAQEVALGWISHYAVGVLYGIILALWGGTAWFATPTFLPAFVLGIVTVGAGWFLLQPGLGIGWAASKLPNANKVRALNLIAHTVFAIGLYGTALLLPGA